MTSSSGTLGTRGALHPALASAHPLSAQHVFTCWHCWDDIAFQYFAKLHMFSIYFTCFKSFPGSDSHLRIACDHGDGNFFHRFRLILVGFWAGGWMVAPQPLGGGGDCRWVGLGPGKKCPPPWGHQFYLWSGDCTSKEEGAKESEPGGGQAPVDTGGWFILLSTRIPQISLPDNFSAELEKIRPPPDPCFGFFL